jgi:hypothetical protein
MFVKLLLLLMRFKRTLQKKVPHNFGVLRV